MDAELTALAAAGATALVQQMVTDGWGNVRDRVVAFFSRGRDEEVVEGELEESRAELAAARAAEDEEAAADVQASWRSRLRRTLRDDPEAAAELRALLDELTPPSALPQQTTVHNTISGGVQHGTVIQAHTVGDLTIGESP
ncbi:hypothetical protein G5C60_42675 [Streptomyces sp. HC44]|uniref:Uncharacterized protein n=1 Tax=Streptomyces scabichelini TaxID=2711217 RepID=A0A6G4VJT0_9ACTN|nr:hypothetical protein [Streptomyces scabichelini]NGO14125.1 hypothetical protein [Streptomyces scabichelini]